LDRMKKKKESKRTQFWKNKKNRVACNPDLGPAVVLSAPRSAFLAYFQLAGASNSLPAKKDKNTHHN
jgi:hypothetical protein